MFLKVFLVILSTCISPLHTLNYQLFPDDTESCTTSKQELGDCLNIRKCPAMIKVLKTATASKNFELIRYLQTSTCGFMGSDPLVCCPKESKLKINEPTDTEIKSDESFEDTTTLPVVPQCGLSNTSNPRIVGGVPAKLNEFPFMTVLGYRNNKNPNIPMWLCGGTLITYTHVLSAAHCLKSRYELYIVRVGELILYDDNDGATPEDIPISKITPHPNFNEVQFTNDICIITLKRRPQNNRMVWPVCLPFMQTMRQHQYTGEVGVVTGWGSVHFNGPRSTILQVVDIPVVTIQNCQRAFGKNTVIDDRIICAGWINAMKDTCQGDSGGPLLYPITDGKITWYYQIGIISYGFRCAEQGYPGVFTRVTNFIDWIKNNTL